MRRGSALLIVLGMLAFMVVSAIGFSVYMRESRIPSSHLRRESSARYLLKSALANAIDRLDGRFDNVHNRIEGVYDDVYPGLNAELKGGSLLDQDNGDFWSHRVFTPFGAVSPLETVSTLTFEGLAYLPPALINEARVFSRMTRTASWENLSYDLGRYAFCAIDVSDCFDINKVYAGERRSSAADACISLSTLFPQNGSTLDNLFDKAGTVPFVSLADFNVVAGDTPFTPFMKYVGTAGAHVYTQSDALSVSNALFITDTWFPQTNAYLTTDLELKTPSSSAAPYDLSSQSDQPFSTYGISDLFGLFTQETRFSREGGVGMANLGMVGLACLYDYLDRDHVPISHCLPCTETAPMVCGFGILPVDFKLSATASGKLQGQHELSGGNNQSPTYEQVVAEKYSIKIPQMTIPLNIAVAFPFKRANLNGVDPSGASVKAVAKLFFAPPGMKCRVNASSPLAEPGSGDWDTEKFENGVLTIPCGTQPRGTVSAKDMPGSAADALFQFSALLKVSQDHELPLFWKVDKSGIDGSTPTPPEHYYSLDGIKGAGDSFVYYDAQTGAAQNWMSALNAQPAMPQPAGGKWTTLPTMTQDAAQGGFCAGVQLVPHLAVWVRIETADGVVDVVPAYPKDDTTWNGRQVFTFLTKSGIFTEEPPLLEFQGSDVKAFTIDESVTGKLDGQADPFQWNYLGAVDPRYNYAPEDWFAGTWNGNDDVSKLWHQTVEGGFLGKHGRDRDIFMFTSDQEYLQSIGELQFIPFVQPTDGTARGGIGAYARPNIDFTGVSLADRQLSATALDNMAFASKNFLWRTYRAYDRADDDMWRAYCNPYEMCDSAGNVVEVVAGKNGYRVNPYTSDSRVMTAAVADTPYDYHVASTNPTCNANANMGLDDARALAFTEDGACEQWSSGEEQAIASELRAAFYEAALDGVRDPAETMANYLDWEDGTIGFAQKGFLGQAMGDPLHGVDRKHLFSFWRECFQNRQQLFLIFLRAEPLTVGGSSGDAIASAQLGARGVALVWRDPNPPNDGGQRAARGSLRNRNAWNTQTKLAGPHRTRVLFYHQFD